MGISYAMICYLMNTFSEGLLLVTAPTLGHAFEHFPFERARFLYSIGFFGDLLWDNPFSGQGQDLSSFDPTKMHTKVPTVGM